MELSKEVNEQFERHAIVAALGWLCDPFRTMDNFQVGDVVQVKSGGPDMTIHALHGDGTFLCQWFDKNGTLQSGDFHPSQLKKVEPQANTGGGYQVRQR